MKKIVEMTFGSHVYGTDLPTSDTDIKGVFIPEPEDILLQNTKVSISQSTRQADARKNRPGDVDHEYFSLHGFVKLLMQGQMVALDMLFTPEKFYRVPPHTVWKELVRNRKRFLHSGVSAFARYCRKQAGKYGIKGSRMAVLRDTLAFLRELPPQEKLSDHWAGIEDYVRSQKKKMAKQKDGLQAGGLIDIVSVRGRDGREEQHLEVCNRKMQKFVKVKYAAAQYQKVYDEYGHRAQQAEKNLGIDWKALMHAVRICEQAKELLLTGKITFPRPEREMLRSIREGTLPYRDVALLIEDGLESLKETEKRSRLPKKPDEDFARNFICRAYSRAVSEMARD